VFRAEPWYRAKSRTWTLDLSAAHVQHRRDANRTQIQPQEMATTHPKEFAAHACRFEIAFAAIGYFISFRSTSKARSELPGRRKLDLGPWRRHRRYQAFVDLNLTTFGKRDRRVPESGWLQEDRAKTPLDAFFVFPAKDYLDCIQTITSSAALSARFCARPDPESSKLRRGPGVSSPGFDAETSRLAYGSTSSVREEGLFLFRCRARRRFRGSHDFAYRSPRQLLTDQILNAGTQWIMVTFGASREFYAKSRPREIDHAGIIWSAVTERRHRGAQSRGAASVRVGQIKPAELAHRVALCLPAIVARGRRHALTSCARTPMALRAETVTAFCFDLSAWHAPAGRSLCPHRRCRASFAGCGKACRPPCSNPATPRDGPMILAGTPGIGLCHRVDGIEVYHDPPEAAQARWARTPIAAQLLKAADAPTKNPRTGARSGWLDSLRAFLSGASGQDTWAIHGRSSRPAYGFSTASLAARLAGRHATKER